MKQFLLTWLIFFLLMLGGLILYRSVTLKPVETAIADEFGPGARDCTSIESRRVRVDCSSALMDGVLYNNLTIDLKFETPLKPQDRYWQEKVISATVLAHLPYKSLLKYWRERMLNRFDLRTLEHLGDGHYRLGFHVIRLDEAARGQILLKRDRLKWVSDDTNPVSLLLERRGTLRFHPLGIPWQLSLTHESDSLFISGSYRE